MGIAVAVYCDRWSPCRKVLCGHRVKRSDAVALVLIPRFYRAPLAGILGDSIGCTVDTKSMPSPITFFYHVFVLADTCYRPAYKASTDLW